MDWSLLNEVVNPRTDRCSFETNKHLFKKVAFDVYRPKSGNTEQLWELRTSDDGESYLYALYGDQDNIVSESSVEQKDFTAASDAEGKNVTLAYKNVPIYRFASEQYQFESSDASNFAEFIESKAQDMKWIQELMNQAMSEERRAAVKKLIQGD